MPNEFQIAETAKPEDVKAPESAADKKKIEHIADEAANKAAKTVQKYDKQNSNLFTK